MVNDHPGDDLVEISVITDKKKDKEGKREAVTELQTINVRNLQHFRAFTDHDQNKDLSLYTAMYFIGNERMVKVECPYEELRVRLDRHAKIKRILHALSAEDIGKVMAFAEELRNKKGS